MKKVKFLYDCYHSFFIDSLNTPIGRKVSLTTIEDRRTVPICILTVCGMICPVPEKQLTCAKKVILNFTAKNNFVISNTLLETTWYVPFSLWSVLLTRRESYMCKKVNVNLTREKTTFNVVYQEHVYYWNLPESSPFIGHVFSLYPPFLLHTWSCWWFVCIPLQVDWRSIFMYLESVANFTNYRVSQKQNKTKQNKKQTNKQKRRKEKNPAIVVKLEIKDRNNTLIYFKK